MASGDFNPKRLPTGPCIFRRSGESCWPDVLTNQGIVSLPRAIVANLRSASTVALVSLSLSIALGIASGATPVMGLRTAIWGGLCVSTFGASPYNIIGPAGALSGMLTTYSDDWGAPDQGDAPPHDSTHPVEDPTDDGDILPWIALFSSLCLMACSALNVQRYLLLMPKSVFEGFTVGVAFIIAFGQINNALGLDKDLWPKRDHLYEKVYDSVSHFGDANKGSMYLFFPETVVLWALCRYVPKVPWMCIIPMSTIVLGYVASLDSVNWDLVTLKEKYDVTPRIADLPDTRALKRVSFFKFVIAVVEVAFVALMETLISAKIAGFRAGDSFNDRGETFGLSISHAVCGLLGGMPGTGVFVRTNINQTVGATCRLSQFMNALMVLVVTAAAMPVFGYLPMATIAAMLMVASVRMVPYGYIATLWRQDKLGFFLCFIVAIVCAVVDCVIGVVFGMLVAFCMNSMEQQTNDKVVTTAVHHDEETGSSAVVVAVCGPLTYSSADAVLDRGAAEGGEGLHHIVDVRGVTQVDTDGLDALHKLVRKLADAAGDAGVEVRGGSGKGVAAEHFEDFWDYRGICGEVGEPGAGTAKAAKGDDLFSARDVSSPHPGAGED